MIERTLERPPTLECAWGIYVSFLHFIIFKRRYVIILLGLGFWESLIRVLIGLGVLRSYIHAYSLQKK